MMVRDSNTGNLPNPNQTDSCPVGLLSSIRAVVPGCIAVAGGPIGTSTSSAYPAENVTIQNAVAKRRREFVSGRQYARSAMAQLGAPPVPIAALPSRAPDWPQGLTGSISHSDAFCVAVVAPESLFVGVGIDVELSDPLPMELYATVCGSSELSAMEPTTNGIDHAKMLFVVKEAFFKLYHPITGYFLDFLEVVVHLDAAGGTFVLDLLDGPPALMHSRTFAGVCGHAEQYCFAFVALHRC
jgi:4'-phosphopantetheinyl transferase EntD